MGRADSLNLSSLDWIGFHCPSFESLFARLLRVLASRVIEYMARLNLRNSLAKTIMTDVLDGWTGPTQVGPDSMRAGDAALLLGFYEDDNSQIPSNPLSTCETPDEITPINATSKSVTKASTHAIGGTLMSDFKDFLYAANTKGPGNDGKLPIWLTEIHSLAEPIVALNDTVDNSEGVERGVWWSPITPVRGDFMAISSTNNQISYVFAADGGFAALAAYYSPVGISIFLANNSQTYVTFPNASTAIEVPVWETFSITCTNSQGCSYNGGAQTTSPYLVRQQSFDNQNGEQEIFVTW